jgi:hypothetical protein
MITSKIFSYILLAFFVGLFFGLFLAWLEKRWMEIDAKYWRDKYLEADKRASDLVKQAIIHHNNSERIEEIEEQEKFKIETNPCSLK